MPPPNPPLSDLVKRPTGRVSTHHLRDLGGRRRDIANSYASLTKWVGQPHSADAKLRCKVPELGPLGVPSLIGGKVPFAWLDNLARLTTRARPAPDRVTPNRPDGGHCTSEPRGKFREQSP